MAEEFESFYIERICRGQNAGALASLAALLALLVRVTEKVFIFTHDLYCPKSTVKDDFTLTEDLQVAKGLETSEIRDQQLSYKDYTLYAIFSEDSKEASVVKKGQPILL